MADAGGTVEPSEGVKIYFNPFAFTVEQNNEFIRRGYEVMPLRFDPRWTQSGGR